MHFAQIRLRNFRNHASSALELGPGINALLGDNGQGKTNIIEAVSYLGLTKSFYAATDAVALQIGKPEFDIEGRVEAQGGIGHAVRVHYDRERSVKEYTIDGTAPETLASVIGRFPVVVLAPEKSAVTFGGPGERRKFIDLILSQVSRSYLEDLLEYRRVLRQRNRLLADARPEGRLEPGVLEPWTGGLVRTGARIMSRRRRFVGEFRPYVRDAYMQLVRVQEEPDLAYRGTVEAGEDDSAEQIAARMEEALAARRIEEGRRGMTLVGPHRDDLDLRIAGMGVQQYASQGQHKSLLVALKVAEYFYVRERSGEVPVVLLDDVFSELDEHRSTRMLGMLADLGQTIISATDERVFHGSVAWNGTHRRFSIEEGTCTPYGAGRKTERSAAGGGSA